MAMSGIFTASTAWITFTLLLSLRVGAMLIATPLFSSANVPVSVRVLFILGFSAALAAGMGTGSLQDPWHRRMVSLSDHPGVMIQAAAGEVALGLTLAVAIHLAFAAFAVAGRLLDIQVGFGLAQVFDPTFNTTTPILTTAFNQVALVVFFIVDGHHAVLRAIGYSLQRFPLGEGWPVDAALAPIVKQMGGVLALAFAMSAPVVFCIMLAELALGVLARNLPQMNMLTMGVPIKIVIGLVTLSLWFSGIGAAMDRVYSGIYATWDATFAAEVVTPAVRGSR